MKSSGKDYGSTENHNLHPSVVYAATVLINTCNIGKCSCFKVRALTHVSSYLTVFVLLISTHVNLVFLVTNEDVIEESRLVQEH